MVVFGFYALTVLMVFAPVLLILRFADLTDTDKHRLLKPYFIWLPIWLIYVLAVSRLGLLDGLDMPPKIPLFIILPVFISILLYQRKLTPYLGRLSTAYGMYIQTFRIAVELLIFGGFVNGLFPQLLTFQGHNMDILVGISASIVALLYVKIKLPKQVFIAWNIISLGVLAHTISTFIQSFYFLNTFTESAAAQFVRVPYVLLPAFLAPMAIFFHILSIRQLMFKSHGD